LAGLKWGELGEWAVAHKRSSLPWLILIDGSRDVLNKMCKFKQIGSGERVLHDCRLASDTV